jgi:hypothetical protein
VDIGALAQRVTGLENGVQDIRGAIGELSKKLDSKPINWWGIIGGIMAILTVVGTAIGMLMSPVNYALERHEREIEHVAQSSVDRADYLRNREETERWVGSLRDRTRFNEDRGVFKEDFSRLDQALAKLSEAAASKADLSDASRRTDERINMVASALHDLQHDFYARPAASAPAGN